MKEYSNEVFQSRLSGGNTNIARIYATIRSE